MRKKIFLRFSAAVLIALTLHISTAIAQTLLPNNDPDLYREGHLSRIKAQESWDLVKQHTQKREVVVAVLDTGVDIDHPDLKNVIWVNTAEVASDGIDNDNNSYIDDVHGWDFITMTPDPRPKLDNGYSLEAVNHGTVISGLLAADVNNGIGIAGAGINIRIMPLRILDGKGSGSTHVLAQAIDYAVENGADIINLSLVGDIKDPALSRSIYDAYRAGVAIVAAAGNQEASGVDMNATPRYPVCDYDSVNRVIGVAALDSQDAIASFSNYGSNCIDIAAPGADLYSTVWHNTAVPALANYYSGGWTGTSAAAPLVSAAIAEIKSVAPQLVLSDVYRSLLLSPTLRSAIVGKEDKGYGILDMQRSVEYALTVSRERPLRVVLASGKGFEPKIIVKNSDRITTSEFYAYNQKFRGGVNVTVGDVDGDRFSEIITAPLSAGGPHIRIFDILGNLKGQFMAYQGKFSGGLNVTTGDVNGDGVAEIITAPTAGVIAPVRIFKANGTLMKEFYPFMANFKGGVRVVAKDIDADGHDDIITTPASNGGPHVRFFDQDGNLKGQFMAYDSQLRGGTFVDVGDVDGDGYTELVTLFETDTSVQTRIFDVQAKEKNRFLIFPELGSDEEASALKVIDITGDGLPEIVTYPLSPGAEIKLFDYYGRVISSIDYAVNARDLKTTRFSFAFIR